MEISIFQMTIRHHAEFLKGQNIISRGLRHVNGPNCRNWSINCGDRPIVIFQFLKLADDAILIFRIREILLDDRVQRAETHRRAKFRQNR